MLYEHVLAAGGPECPDLAGGVARGAQLRAAVAQDRLGPAGEQGDVAAVDASDAFGDRVDFREVERLTGRASLQRQRRVDRGAYGLDHHVGIELRRVDAQPKIELERRRVERCHAEGDTRRRESGKALLELDAEISERGVVHGNHCDLDVLAAVGCAGNVEGAGVPDAGLAAGEVFEVPQRDPAAERAQMRGRIGPDAGEVFHVLSAGGCDRLVDSIDKRVRFHRLLEACGCQVVALRTRAGAIARPYVAAAGGQASSVHAVAEAKADVAFLGHLGGVMGVVGFGIRQRRDFLVEPVVHPDRNRGANAGFEGGVGDKGDGFLGEVEALAGPCRVAAAQRDVGFGLAVARRHRVGADREIADLEAAELLGGGVEHEAWIGGLGGRLHDAGDRGGERRRGRSRFDGVDDDRLSGGQAGRDFGGGDLEHQVRGRRREGVAVEAVGAERGRERAVKAGDAGQCRRHFVQHERVAVLALAHGDDAHGRKMAGGALGDHPVAGRDVSGTALEVHVGPGRRGFAARQGRGRHLVEIVERGAEEGELREALRGIQNEVRAFQYGVEQAAVGIRADHRKIGSAVEGEAEFPRTVDHLAFMAQGAVERDATAGNVLAGRPDVGHRDTEAVGRDDAGEACCAAALPADHLPGGETDRGRKPQHAGAVECDLSHIVGFDQELRVAEDVRRLLVGNDDEFPLRFLDDFRNRQFFLPDGVDEDRTCIRVLRVRVADQDGGLPDRDLGVFRFQPAVAVAERLERIEFVRIVVPVLQVQGVQGRVDSDVGKRLEDQRRPAVLWCVADLEAGGDGAGKDTGFRVEREGGRGRGRRQRAVVEHGDEPPQVVPLRGGADAALVGEGVRMLGHHMGGAGEGAGDLPAPVLAVVAVAVEDAAQALGVGFVGRHLRLGGGDVVPVGEIRGQPGAQGFEQRHRVGPDVAEALETGAVPAGEIVGMAVRRHPLMPPLA